jgi:hypothetical protein
LKSLKAPSFQPYGLRAPGFNPEFYKMCFPGFKDLLLQMGQLVFRYSEADAALSKATEAVRERSTEAARRAERGAEELAEMHRTLIAVQGEAAEAAGATDAVGAVHVECHKLNVTQLNVT